MIVLIPSDALLVVDVQNDFLPGGSLAVPHGDVVIAPINELISCFARNGLRIFASRDWHPAHHCSFHEQGGPWPPHCIAGTWGAEFSRQLRLTGRVELVSKATRLDVDAYSCFDGTDLLERLRTYGIERVFIAGLTMEYCVLYSSRDAIKAGLKAMVVEDALAAIDPRPETVEEVKREMREAGASFVGTAEVLGISRAA